MYSGDDAIKLLKIELPRLTGKYSFSYSYRLTNTDHVVSGAGYGHEDARKLLRHLEKYRPERVDLSLTLF